MTVVYVLAHFDDEFLAWPLIRRDLAEGCDLSFVHVADYRGAESARRRHAETLAFLAALGVAADRQIHLGAGTGWWDGQLHAHAADAYAALTAAVSGPVERVVVPAWEGGHPDHDLGAALTARLAGEMGGAPVEQVSLYNSPNLPWIFYHGARPLPQNGPVSRMPLSGADWLRWAVSVADYPSQARTWLGLWPAMAMTLARQRDFRWQTLRPERIAERPHEGPLFYERMFKVPYAAVRQAVDSLGPVG